MKLKKPDKFVANTQGYFETFYYYSWPSFFDRLSLALNSGRKREDILKAAEGLKVNGNPMFIRRTTYGTEETKGYRPTRFMYYDYTHEEDAIGFSDIYYRMPRGAKAVVELAKAWNEEFGIGWKMIYEDGESIENEFLYEEQ